MKNPFFKHFFIYPGFLGCCQLLYYYKYRYRQSLGQVLYYDETTSSTQSMWIYLSNIILIKSSIRVLYLSVWLLQITLMWVKLPSPMYDHFQILNMNSEHPIRGIRERSGGPGGELDILNELESWLMTVEYFILNILFDLYIINKCSLSQ